MSTFFYIILVCVFMKRMRHCDSTVASTK